MESKRGREGGWMGGWSSMSYLICHLTALTSPPPPLCHPTLFATCSFQPPPPTSPHLPLNALHLYCLVFIVTPFPLGSNLCITAIDRLSEIFRKYALVRSPLQSNVGTDSLTDTAFRKQFCKIDHNFKHSSSQYFTLVWLVLIKETLLPRTLRCLYLFWLFLVFHTHRFFPLRTRWCIVCICWYSCLTSCCAPKSFTTNCARDFYNLFKFLYLCSI